MHTSIIYLTIHRFFWHFNSEENSRFVYILHIQHSSPWILAALQESLLPLILSLDCKLLWLSAQCHYLDKNVKQNKMKLKGMIGWNIYMVFKYLKWLLQIDNGLKFISKKSQLHCAVINEDSYSWKTKYMTICPWQIRVNLDTCKIHN